MNVNTIAIIGAGPSGLVTAKEAKEHGLVPVVFEQSSTIGGNWRPESGKTWDGMQINNSRNASTFSDFDWEPESVDFPNQKAVYNYLLRYASHFKLGEHVKLNSCITKVEQVETKWRLTFRVKEEQEMQASFDFLVVCSGFLSRPHIPELPGLSSFDGTKLHTQDYKNPQRYKGRRVAVIGNAFSGSEIASEIAQTASKVYHIFQRPRWILTRYLKEQASERTLPFDLSLHRRANLSLPLHTPLPERYARGNSNLGTLCKTQAVLAPELAISLPCSNAPFVTISDTYLSDVQKASIVTKRASITRLEANKITLSDASTIEVDDIVFGTGYRTELAFFSAQMREALSFEQEDPLLPLPLYKAVLAPKFSNLAFVGLVRFGIYFGPIEMQARLACMIFSGKIPQPTAEKLNEGLLSELNIRNMTPRSQFGNRDYMRYSDDLAHEIGALPDFDKLKKENPELYDKLWNGPYTAASYRLVGFGSKSELAMKKINELFLRAPRPLTTPVCDYLSQKR